MSAGITKPTQFRLGDQSLALLERIASLPQFEGNRTAVVKAAISLLYEREIGPIPTPKKSRKKSG